MGGGYICIYNIYLSIYLYVKKYLAVDPLAVPLEELHARLALLLGDEGPGHVPAIDDKARLGLL